MIFLISHKGRGLLVFPLVLVPIALAGTFDAIFGRYFMLGFSFGFVLIGILCWILGRRWTAMGRDDRFCGGSVQTWGSSTPASAGCYCPRRSAPRCMDFRFADRPI